MLESGAGMVETLVLGVTCIALVDGTREQDSPAASE